MEEAIHPWLLQRKIIHFDMDAFYAAVEIRHRPDLAGKPLVIGGSPQSRGVVCTASYEARRFGVRSAMACSQAARLCPEAIFLPPDFAKYKEASREIHEVFRRYTAAIEPLSLDEAYLDVTDNPAGLYAIAIAKQIQDAIREELHLSGSAGVAPNKLVAKIASDVHKPQGITVVLPQQVRRFMEQLPLRRIHGIGPASEKRLAELGLHLCRDVWSWSRDRLDAELGSMGSWLYDRSRGLDQRMVEPHRERKSLGREETFASDKLGLAELLSPLASMSLEVAAALSSRGLKGRTVSLKVKYADFTLSTRSLSLHEATDSAEQILAVARELLEMTEVQERKVRLLGVSLSNLKARQEGDPALPSLLPV